MTQQKDNLKHQHIQNLKHQHIHKIKIKFPIIAIFFPNQKLNKFIIKIQIKCQILENFGPQRLN